MSITKAEVEGEFISDPAEIEFRTHSTFIREFRFFDITNIKKKSQYRYMKAEGILGLNSYNDQSGGKTLNFVDYIRKHQKVDLPVVSFYINKKRDESLVKFGGFDVKGY